MIGGREACDVTHSEALSIIGQCQRQANGALDKHHVAMQAFQVACARGRWVDAEAEQATALEQLGVNLDAVQAIYRVRAELGDE